ncbi:MAG: hypothetical protein AAFQ37_11310 [Bacteroidota bacterium]
MAEQGASIDVLTSSAAGDRPIDPAYNHPFPTHFVPGQGLRDVLSSPGATSFSSATKQQPLFQFFASLRQSFPLHYWTDEGGPTYRRNAYRLAIQLVKERGITHLLSSYRPWVDHLIAARLKQRFPKLIWWADFRDLPIDPVRRDVYLPSLQTNYAKRIIRAADCILCVSEGQATHLRRLHPNVEVVYAGLTDFPRPTAPQTDKFTINYTGSLYPKLQSLGPLKELLPNWLSTDKRGYFAVSYAGKDEAIMARWLKPYLPADVLQLEGVIDQANARKLQEAASVNLLLNWSTPSYFGVLTAKLYDYLSAGRPILAIVNGPDDPELRNIIEGSGAGRVFTVHDEVGIEGWLSELFHSWRNTDGKLPWETNRESLQYLQPQPILRKLLHET